MEWPLTVNSQEEFDSLVHDRLERERTKAAEAQARAEKAEGSLAEADARAKKAEGAVADLKAARALAEAKAKVASDTGVPADLIKDGTEEEMRTHAEALAAYAKPPAAPFVGNDGGGAIKPPAPNETMDFVNRLRH